MGDKKHRKPEAGERKADTTRNSEGLDELIRKQMQKEKKLHPLKINSTTYIYVPKRKCNEKYAEAYRKKMEGRD